MEVYWIWLSELEGLPPKGKLRVIAAFGTPEAAFRASKEEIFSRKGLTGDDCDALLNRDLTNAQKILESCWERNISVLTMQDCRYPELLRNISDPPLVLYYVGSLPDFDRELTIAVVGQRKASGSGLLAARRLGYELSLAGTIVVSGCAEGIDAAAMEGALQGGSPVVGVLGGGVDVVYPRKNRRLFESVRDYGCLISEYPPGTPPIGWHFPIRNRIISGLSRGVVVAEAPRKSGSLITAEHAVEQGRDVFAMPGTAGLNSCAGSNDLLRQGASIAETGNDVLMGYAYLFEGHVHMLEAEEASGYEQIFLELPDNGNEKIAASIVETPQLSDKKDVDKAEKQPYIDVHKAAAGLPPEDAAVLCLLEDGPLQTDQIIRSCGMTASRVLGILTMLEIRGLIRALPGGSYSLRENL